MIIRPGTRIAGRYEVIREQPAAPFYRAALVKDAEGDGGEALIWLIFPMLLPSEEARRRFVDNAVNVKAAADPHLARIVDVGVAEDRVYVVAPQLDGQSIADRIAAAEAAPDAVVAHVAASLGEGLHAAHLAELVHGWLRPEDVVMAGELARISGAGLWGALDRQAAMSAFKAAHLLAPEVRAGEASTPRSDVYSLAVVLAQLAFGMAAESGAEAAVLRDRLRRERPRLDAALARAFSPVPEERPATALALAATLADLIPRRLRRAAPARELTPVAGHAMVDVGDSGSWEKLPWESPNDAPTVRVDPDTPLPILNTPRPAEITPRPAGTTPRPQPLVTFKRGVVTPPHPETLPRQPDSYPHATGEVPRLVLDPGSAPPRIATPIADVATAPTRAPTPTGTMAAAAPRAPARRPAAQVAGTIAYVGACALLVVAAVVGGRVLVERLRGASSSSAAGAITAVGPEEPGEPAPAPAPVAALPASPCANDQVLVAAEGLRFCIDAHEAPGRGNTPIAGVSFEAARAACAAKGRRLCAAAEWEEACRGPRRASYPWGNAPTVRSCNLRRDARGALQPAGSLETCVSAAGAYDMAGNVAEWVADGRTRGGSATDGDDGRCSKDRVRADGAAPADVGYRCCSDAAF